jgi:hypothetical protein
MFGGHRNHHGGGMGHCHPGGGGIFARMMFARAANLDGAQLRAQRQQRIQAEHHHNQQYSEELALRRVHQEEERAEAARLKLEREEQERKEDQRRREERNERIALNFDNAVGAKKEGRLSDAKQYFKAVLRDDDDHASSLLGLAEIYEQDQEFANAINVLSKIHPRTPEILSRLATLSKQVGDLQLQLGYEKELISYPAYRLQSQKNCLALYVTLGQYKDAVDLFLQINTHHVEQEDFRLFETAKKVLLQQFEETCANLEGINPSRYPEALVLYKKIMDFENGLSNYEFAHAIKQRLLNLKQFYHPQNFLWVEKRAVLKILREMDDSQATYCLCFIKDAYHNLRQWLVQINGIFRNDAVDLVSFVNHRNEDNFSIIRFLKGEKSTSRDYQRFIDALNRESENLGNHLDHWVEQGVEKLPNPNNVTLQYLPSAPPPPYEEPDTSYQALNPMKMY